MITNKLIDEVVDRFQLDILGDHGLSHWARVFENGTRLARANGGNEDIVQLFALFHDSCRIHELCDPDHGVRGGNLAGELFFDFDMGISKDGLLVLAEACATHTSQAIHAWPTIQCCYDADRLDLARVGIHPDAMRLGSEAAVNMMGRCGLHAMLGVVPANMLGMTYREIKQEA